MRKCVWFLTTLVKDTFILVLWYRTFMDVEIEEGGGLPPISRCDIPNFHFAAENGIFHIELTKPPLSFSLLIK